MKVALLDLNVLMALAWPSHVNHQSAHQWFKEESQYGWATCPITQMGLIRLSSNSKIIKDAVSPMTALNLLKDLTKRPEHSFWADNIAVVADDNDMFQFYDKYNYILLSPIFVGCLALLGG